MTAQPWDPDYDWGYGRTDENQLLNMLVRITVADSDEEVCANLRRALREGFSRETHAQGVPPGFGVWVGGASMLRFGAGTSDEPVLIAICSGGQDAVDSVEMCTDAIWTMIEKFADVIDVQWNIKPYTSSEV